MSKESSTSGDFVYDVVIVGGGPVGLCLGLSLAKQGLQCKVLEAATEHVPSPRALMYYPIVLNEFEKLGLLDEVVAAGYKNQEGLTFRTPAGSTNKVLAKIPPGRARTGAIDFGVQLGQHELVRILRKHALEQKKFSIEYDRRFVSLEERHDDVLVHTESADNTKRSYRARFVAACDGASSPVRKFLNIPFEGFTWKDWRFLAINIKYDFTKYGYSGASQVVDPEDWAVIVRASNEREGLWRVATGIDPQVEDQDVEQHARKKLEKLLPGPRPLDYELVAVNPYWAHERVAKVYRSGRVFLCGDSAHICNPLSALGLTTGLVDVAHISRLLPLAFSGKASLRWEVLLDRYATLRRKDFVDRVQKQAIDGKLRLHSKERKVISQREDFFNMLNKNPEFGNFVAGTQMQTVPNDLLPSLWTRIMIAFAKIWEAMCIIPMIIFWKIRASMT